MRQSLWRRAWRRLLVCTVEGGCFLNRERRDVWSYAILGERLCAPRMFLVVSADQGAVAVLYGRDIDFHGSTAYSTTQCTHPEVPDTLRSSYDLIPDPDARVAA